MLLVYAGARKRGALGIGEVVIGAAALFTNVLAAPVAILYVAFAAYVVDAIRKGKQDCGCFGAEARTVPTWTHVVINLGLATAAALSALTNGPAPIAQALDTPFAGTVYAVYIAVTTAMTAALMSKTKAAAR